MKRANELGWQLSASLDVSSKFVSNDNQQYPIDVHSWFFCKDFKGLSDLSPNTFVQSDTNSVLASAPPMGQDLSLRGHVENLPPSYSEVMAGATNSNVQIQSENFTKPHEQYPPNLSENPLEPSSIFSVPTGTILEPLAMPLSGSSILNPPSHFPPVQFSDPKMESIAQPTQFTDTRDDQTVPFPGSLPYPLTPSAQFSDPTLEQQVQTSQFSGFSFNASVPSAPPVSKTLPYPPGPSSYVPVHSPAPTGWSLPPS